MNVTLVPLGSRGFTVIRNIGDINILVAMRTRTVVLVGRDKRGMQAQERLKEGTMDQQGLSHGQAHTLLLSLASPWDRLDSPAASCCHQAGLPTGWTGVCG